MLEQEREAIVNAEHVRVLSICYYVSAGIHAAFSVFGLLYVFMAVFMTAAMSRLPTTPGEQPPPEFIGIVFGVIGLVMFAIMVGIGALHFLVARWLGRRGWRTACLVVAAATCLLIPYGTVLGVFTLVVLTRPSVAATFDIPSPPVVAGAGPGAA